MEYAHPEVLVDTQWVEDHLKDSNVRIAEVDYDPKANYLLGHVPGAVLFDWKGDINDPTLRNVLSKDSCEKLLQNTGLNDNTILILYGDFNNWFAAFAFWVFKYYGYKDVRLMNGGRKKWLEEDRALSKDVPSNISRGNFKATGAENIPWAQAVKEDGTFKSRDELESMYKNKGIVPERDIIAYCRIGERSSHTWFVLKYLLGYPNVRNYDGSWTEWGNMIANPIEK
jgi:thiosulfate/3-mercaptopyruvate sulfurtransferase